MIELLEAGLSALQLPSSAAPVLDQYGQALVEKNKVMNLTAITAPIDVAQKHMLDCAAVLNAENFQEKRVIDVGTGAGFPGLVLKICEPSIDLTLFDSLQKRIEWLKEISSFLNAPASAVHGRAEEFGHFPEYREQFDIATARAVADLRMLCELCLPFVKVGGVFLAMKTEECSEELNEAGRCISLMGGKLKPAYHYVIPGTDLHRQIIRIEKVSPTPQKYPRRFARIQKTPL